MKDIEKRIKAVERRAYYAENQVCVLVPTVDGWRLTINGKDKVFSSEDEAEAYFRKVTGSDSVLIVWGKKHERK